MTTWSFACPDWVERLRSGRSLVPDLPIDEGEAERAVAIFDKLRLPDVPGRPMMADAAGDWFRDIVRALFGSIDAEGVRRVPEIFALVPKKNSKTTGGAAIMVTALLLNRRPRAEFLLVGPTQEVADLAFAQAEGMIAADETLSKLFHVQEHLKRITHRRTQAVLKIKTFDMKVMTGSKPSGVLVDELHIMATASYASRVIGQIRGGLLPNPEGFLAIITTQSDEPPAGVFRAELQHARAIRDGRSTGRMLPILYEFPEAIQTAPDKPWRDPEQWPMVLPNLGRSITLQRLVEDYAGARAKGDEEERRWASQHLNIEIGLALHADRWRGADHWEAATDPTLTLDSLIERSEVVTIGIDGGGLDDLLGLAVIGRERITKRWLHWGRAWADREVRSRRKDIAERLADFERDGDLTFVDIGPRHESAGRAATEVEINEDIAELVAIVEKVWASGRLPGTSGIGLDPVGVAAIVDALVETGIPSETLVGIPQGYKLSGIVAGTARKLKDGSLVHADQPLMAWCVGNAKSELRGSALLITKQTSGSAKIDPLMALFDAADLMSRNPAATGPSVYETRGLLMV